MRFVFYSHLHHTLDVSFCTNFHNTIAGIEHCSLNPVISEWTKLVLDGKDNARNGQTECDRRNDLAIREEVYDPTFMKEARERRDERYQETGNLTSNSQSVRKRIKSLSLSLMHASIHTSFVFLIFLLEP